MEIILIWIAFCLLIAYFGDSRKIGCLGSFFISLLLSPLIGLVAVLVSDKKEDPKQVPKKETNYISELNGLADLRDRKIISETEFEEHKKKLLADWDKSNR